MSALQFLNKKSWHTSTLRNNEKLWIREQEAEKEKSRIEELQKQLAEERRQEALFRLEEESGRVDASAAAKRRRINWMYEYDETEEGAKTPEGKESEDVMLGKKEVNVEEVGEAERVERAALVDVEAKMREDPLLQMKMSIAKTRGSLPTNCDKKAGVNEKALEKMQRKEERRRIREDRQKRRNDRVIRKKRHTDDRGAPYDADRFYSASGTRYPRSERMERHHDY